LLKGSTDDYQQSVARGTMTFYTNYFRLDSVYDRTSMNGSSDYSGMEFTFSGMYRSEYLTVGFSVKPPSKITRKFSMQGVRDTTGSLNTSTVSGEDKLKLPWRGTVGFSIAPKDNLVLGLEYEIRSYESAVYTRADGTTSNPWVSSGVFHGGLQYTPLQWLAIRGGIRGQAEVFQPEGNPIVGEPVAYTIYSAGVGFSYVGIHLNVTYEYGSLRYQDVWGSAISQNTDDQHTLVADLVYELPLSFGRPK